MTQKWVDAMPAWPKIRSSIKLRFLASRSTSGTDDPAVIAFDVGCRYSGKALL
jgi:hypothetical protein